MVNDSRLLLNGTNLINLCDVAIYSSNMSPLESIRKNELVFCKTDFLLKIFSYLQGCDFPIRLISHCSDIAITKQIVECAPKCVKTGKWWAQNLDFFDDFVFPIPIGFENVHTKASSWEKLSAFIGKTNLGIDKVYCNFGPTNPIRNSIRQKITQAGGVARDRVPFFDYVDDLTRYKYCASPRGNGIDCMRTWEALICGCTPIVDKHKMFDIFRSPTIQTTDWNINNLRSATVDGINMDIIDIRYWVEEMKVLDFPHKTPIFSP